jgi:2-polyprenyl-3-methyl-5-hydroxy-6-metoxy-1,4-benzoquinol methylase
MQVDTDKLFDPKYFDHISCNLCGASDTQADVIFKPDEDNIPRTEEQLSKVYSSSSGHVLYERVIRCRNCGLIYISPRPKIPLIVGGYSTAEDHRYVSQERGRRISFEESLRTIKHFCKRGRLLDVGAASGIFMKMADDAGYETCGIEPSAWMCEAAKRLYDIEVFPGVLDEAGFEESSFDIATLWDVLEHVPDPMATLKEVRKVLKPGGLLLISYPRIDDFLARLFGRKWWFLLSVHLFYFTQETLSRYLECLGFNRMLHMMLFQRLEYSYLVERLEVYSRTLAKIAQLPYRIPGVQGLLIPYFASQYLMVARKSP